MHLYFIPNSTGFPESKLADVEIHFLADGFLAGVKLVGISIWRSKKGDTPTVLLPSKSYSASGGVRYFALLRPADEGHTAEEVRSSNLERTLQLKEYILEKYLEFSEK